MMMQYSTSRNRGNRGVIVLIATLFAVVFLSVFQGFVRETVFGVVGMFSVEGTAGGQYALVSRAVLAERLAAAEEELRRTRYQSILFERAAEENKRLLAFLGLRRPDAYSSGAVLAIPPRTHYDTALLSVPDGASPERGDLAVLSGVLMGTITDVSGRIVTVTFLSAPGAATDARVGDHAVVVLRGVGGGGFSFDVPVDFSLNRGDVIRSADGAFVIALVSSVHASPGQTSARVMAHAPVSLQHLTALEFIRVHSYE